jgi:hypothetical protein
MVGKGPATREEEKEIKLEGEIKLWNDNKVDVMN